MRIPAEQPFVPVILGGDIGTYSLAREFHQQYKAISVVVPSVLTGITRYSRILEVRPFAEQADEAAFRRFLTELGAELSATPQGRRPLLLLGGADPHIRFIARNAEALGEYFTIPYVGEDLLDRVTGKDAFYELCRQLQVPYPRTVVHDCSGADTGMAELEPALAQEGIGFPAIVKPSDGVAWGQLEFSGKKKVHTVASTAQLRELIGKATAAGYTDTLVIQDLVPGGDGGMNIATFFSDRQGNVRFASCGSVLVEEHAPGALGNSAAIIATPNERLVADGQKILNELGWTGFSMFDAKLDPRDGSYRFFELNPRLGRNHFYISAAGHNVSRFYVEEYLEGGLRGPQQLEQSRNEHLYTILPLRLLRRYLPADRRDLVERLIKSRAVSHPLSYRRETDPRRWYYILVSTLNHYRKFKRNPPPMD